MATRQAGTLVTTHNATYKSPSLMPGYGGYVPKVKSEYGHTYGHITQKYFQDYRSETLKNSTSSYRKGGYFPTHYSHDPHLVIGSRTDDRNRWLVLPQCEPSSTDRARDKTLHKFADLVSQHQEYYKDRTGQAQRVKEFVIPKPIGYLPKDNCC